MFVINRTFKEGYEKNSRISNRDIRLFILFRLSDQAIGAEYNNKNRQLLPPVLYFFR